MPTLPLDHPFGLREIPSYCLYPALDEDEDLKRTAHFAETVRVSLAAQLKLGNYELPKPLVELTLNYPVFPHDYEQRLWKGSLVGQMMNWLWALYCYDPILMSWNNAIKITAKIQHEIGSPISERSLRATRDQMISVAHLWGAQWNLLYHRLSSADDDDLSPVSQMGLLVRKSEAFREFGTTVSQSRAKSAPPLADSVLWVPSDQWRAAQLSNDDRSMSMDDISPPRIPDLVLADLRAPGRPRKPTNK